MTLCHTQAYHLHALGPFKINSFARNIIGFSTIDSVQLLLITNALSIPVRPIFGYLADSYIGPINMYVMATCAFGIVTFSWGGVHDRAGMYVFAICFGIASGTAQGVFVGSLASLTKDPRKMGTRFGMVCTLVAFATLAGPPTAGAIIDSSGGKYLHAQMWAGSVMLTASLLFATSRFASTGLRLRVKV